MGGHLSRASDRGDASVRSLNVEWSLVLSDYDCYYSKAVVVGGGAVTR